MSDADEEISFDIAVIEHSGMSPRQSGLSDESIGFEDDVDVSAAPQPTATVVIPDPFSLTVMDCDEGKC